MRADDLSRHFSPCGDVVKALLDSATGRYLLFDRQLRAIAVSRNLASDIGLPVEALYHRSIDAIFLNLTEEDHSEAGRPLSRDFRAELRRVSGAPRAVQAHVHALTVDGRDYRFVDIMPDPADCGPDGLDTDGITRIGHELRAPLSAVTGALELVLAGNTGQIGADTNGMVSIALRNSRRLMRLIDDLLDLKRIAMGRYRLKMESYSGSAILRAAVDDIAALAAQRMIEVHLDTDPGRDTCWIDKDRLRQVFDNLLQNAIKFSPSQSRISIESQADDGLFRVSIVDQGVGVPPHLSQRIFDKFFQIEAADAVHHIGEGIGLGLAISREIVEQFDGRLWVEPNPSGGSIFIVELPLQGAAPRS